MKTRKIKRAYIYIEIQGDFLELGTFSTYDSDLRHRPISQQLKVLHKISDRFIKQKKSYARSKLKFCQFPQIRYFLLQIPNSHFCQDVFLHTRALHTHTTHIKRKIINWRNQPLQLEGHPITLFKVTSSESLIAYDKLSKFPMKTKCTTVKTFFFTLVHCTHTLHT